MERILGPEFCFWIFQIFQRVLIAFHKYFLLQDWLYAGSKYGQVYHYLTNKKQRNTISSNCSSYTEILSGVPKGLIFGPALFIISISYLILLAGGVDTCPNDITTCSRGDNISCFLFPWPISQYLFYLV